MVRTLVAALTVAALMVCAAWADHGKGKGRGRSKGDTVVVHEKDKGRDEVAVFSVRDRDAVRSYWVHSYGRGKCPPGLAKKHNGCLPPGQAKKRYIVGQRLPAAVVVQPLPPVLLTRLAPPPVGYEYVMVDGDILELAVGTRLVADAIAALVD